MLARFAASLPSQCEVCRGWGAGRLCEPCVQRHAPPRPRCARCGLATGMPVALCGECQRDPPPHASTVCALDYGFPWDRMISAFKFQDHVELAAPLSALLGRAIARDGTPPPDLVVPVPLTASRLASRGYNQAWELARRLAREHGLHADAGALQRVLDTPAQAALARAERQRNLRGAFAPNGARAAGRDVALVDDVMTTGATAREAAAALLRGGARSVRLWVLARTPPPGD